MHLTNPTIKGAASADSSSPSLRLLRQIKAAGGSEGTRRLEALAVRLRAERAALEVSAAGAVAEAREWRAAAREHAAAVLALGQVRGTRFHSRSTASKSVGGTTVAFALIYRLGMVKNIALYMGCMCGSWVRESNGNTGQGWGHTRGLGEIFSQFLLVLFRISGHRRASLLCSLPHDRRMYYRGGRRFESFDEVEPCTITPSIHSSRRHAQKSASRCTCRLPCRTHAPRLFYRTIYKTIKTSASVFLM